MNSFHSAEGGPGAASFSKVSELPGVTKVSQAQGSAVPSGSAAQAADRQLVNALGGMDANRTRAVSNRTRRAVHNAAADMREGRQLNRRNLGVALLILGGLLILLSPAIWNSLDELLGGEFLLDLPGMVAALAFTLFAAVAAVLFLLSGNGEHRLGDSRR